TGSLDVRISLGPDLYGKSAGYLHLYADQPSALLYTPAGLTPIIGRDLFDRGHDDPWPLTTDDDLNLSRVVMRNATAFFFRTNTGYSICLSNMAPNPPQ